jgi:hypothetical protein
MIFKGLASWGGFCWENAHKVSRCWFLGVQIIKGGKHGKDS